MGQKVNPIGFRLGIVRGWNSKWYEEKRYAEWLHEDLKIRQFIKKELYAAGISKIEIERMANKVKVSVSTARPGVVIGKGGAGADELKRKLKRLTKGEVFLDVLEIRKAELDATLAAENIAAQLERRVAFRRALKKVMQAGMKFGAKGFRVAASGRLGGAEMGRFESYREGRVPLHTLRANIDFGTAIAKTTYGVIGIKCWIFKGEVYDNTTPNATRGRR